MNDLNEKNNLNNRSEQLEQMLRLYMHEVSHFTFTIDYVLHDVMQEIESDVDVALGENYADSLRDKVKRSYDNIADLLKMMELLKDNIRIGMGLSQFYGVQTDVHIYKDIIFKLKNIYQRECYHKKLAFLTPVVTFTDDVKISLNTSKNLLELVIYNIISNAVKFSHKGTNIYVESKKIFSDSNARIIQVTDYGVQIEENNNPYKLYYRGLESSLSEGTGLGLYATKKAIDHLGGQIRHRCMRVSDYNVPYIFEYINRFSNSIDACHHLLKDLHYEVERLENQHLYERIVFRQDLSSIPDEEVRSNICIATYETSFEVII